MAKEILNDSSSESSDSESGGATVPTLKVNAEYAKRFEHNKKREELQKLEEKLGKPSLKRKRDGRDESDSGSSSSSEDEDDEGELATAALDSEIMATLNAIRSKDPRVYNAEAKFYTEADENGVSTTKEKTERPMYLRDYHRENLLNGIRPEQEETDQLSYSQQQEQLKKSVVNEFHAAADSSESSDSDDEGGLLVRKPKAKADGPASAVPVDVATADHDPETFLSNFMAARAWVPTDRAELHPFESDDEEEDERAEKFEEAYNLRFEDPEKSNATLHSFSRQTAEKYSVRRDTENPRKKKREAEKAAKEAAKQELRDQKARLKKLRMEEVEEKVRRIKRAAGLKTEDIRPEDWSRFIDEEWSDKEWEEEMQKRFGDHYYAEQEALNEESAQSDEGEAEGNPTTSKKKKRKPRKPKFEDDIDIKDIVPDFEEEDQADFSLSDDEENNQNDNPAKKTKSKTKKQERIDKQKESRKDRRIIEQLVDTHLQLDLEHTLPEHSRAKSAGFRYRETSPQAFGLTHRDILLADDSALNQFAGLKKLAAYRDEDKKKKDKKHLGKKARLRKWRMETFGDEDGPKIELSATSGTLKNNEREGSDEEIGGVDIREGGRKKKGRRKNKKARIEDGATAS